MSGTATTYQRTSVGSGPTLITALVHGCSRSGSQAAASGRVLGLSIIYDRSLDPGTGRPRSRIIPWYVDAQPQDGSIGTITTFPTASSFLRYATVGSRPVIEAGMVSFPLPDDSAVSSYFLAADTLTMMQTGAGSTATAMASGSCIHVCFEPGTGIPHAAFGSTTQPSIGVPFSTLMTGDGNTVTGYGTGITSLRQLATTDALPFEMNLHASASGIKRFRVLVLATGSTDVRSPRD